MHLSQNLHIHYVQTSTSFRKYTTLHQPKSPHKLTNFDIPKILVHPNSKKTPDCKPGQKLVEETMLSSSLPPQSKLRSLLLLSLALSSLLLSFWHDWLALVRRPHLDFGTIDHCNNFTMVTLLPQPYYNLVPGMNRNK